MKFRRELLRVKIYLKEVDKLASVLSLISPEKCHLIVDNRLICVESHNLVLSWPGYSLLSSDWIEDIP